MSRRKRWEKYRNHDSRRWLKHHPPCHGDRYRDMLPKEVWEAEVRQAVARWPTLRSRPAVYRSIRAGPSAESAYLMGGNRWGEALDYALLDLGREEDGSRKVRLIRMIYLDHAWGVSKAAEKVEVSEATARRWIKRFRRAVAWRLGYGGEGVG